MTKNESILSNSSATHVRKKTAAVCLAMLSDGVNPWVMAPGIVGHEFFCWVRLLGFGAQRQRAGKVNLRGRYPQGSIRSAPSVQRKTPSQRSSHQRVLADRLGVGVRKGGAPAQLAPAGWQQYERSGARTGHHPEVDLLRRRASSDHRRHLSSCPQSGLHEPWRRSRHVDLPDRMAASVSSDNYWGAEQLTEARVAGSMPRIVVRRTGPEV